VQANHGWMVMEMATGGELFDRLIDSGSLSERAAWPYASALVAALDHCLKHAVVHRDVKLENIMLCAEDPRAIRLIDFGLAVQLPLDGDGRPDPAFELTDSAGTQAYRAPEVSMAGYQPHKVDVWAAGIVLFSLCAGFFPLQEAKEDDWRYRKLVRDQLAGVGACDSIFRMYRRTCGYSSELKTLLDHMLLVDVGKRWSVTDVKGAAWLETPPAGPPEAQGDGEETVFRGLSADDDDMAPLELPEDAVPIARQRANRAVPPMAEGAMMDLS